MGPQLVPSLSDVQLESLPVVVQLMVPQAAAVEPRPWYVQLPRPSPAGLARTSARHWPEHWPSWTSRPFGAHRAEAPPHHRPASLRRWTRGAVEWLPMTVSRPARRRRAQRRGQDCVRAMETPKSMGPGAAVDPAAEAVTQVGQAAGPLAISARVAAAPHRPSAFGGPRQTAGWPQRRPSSPGGTSRRAEHSEGAKRSEGP